MGMFVARAYNYSSNIRIRVAVQQLICLFGMQISHLVVR